MKRLLTYPEVVGAVIAVIGGFLFSVILGYLEGRIGFKAVITIAALIAIVLLVVLLYKLTGPRRTAGAGVAMLVIGLVVFVASSRPREGGSPSEIVIPTAAKPATAAPTATAGVEAAMPDTPTIVAVPPTGTPQPPPATATPAPPTPTPAPPTPEGPTPLPGTGSAMGRILWNGQPVGDLEVKLCEKVSMVGGCSGLEFSARTGEAGDYLIADVPPGEYSLVAHALGAERWLYVTTGLGPGARKYTVGADQTLRVGDHHVYRFDLVSTAPADGSQVDTATPTLAWEGYPGASTYELYLRPEKGNAIFVGHRTDGNDLGLEAPLLNCKYTWTVDAFNAEGIKIAETDGYRGFTVTGQPVSCYLDITAPLDNATVPGTALSLSWEAHPLAASYKILMWNDTDESKPHLLDFTEVREPGYAFDHTLPPASYVWCVYAYDGEGEEIAGSEVQSFNVTGP